MSPPDTARVPLSDAEIDQSLAMARAVRNGAPARVVTPGPAKIRVPMTCSVTGEPWVALIEIRNGVAWFVGSEMSQPRFGDRAERVPPLLGRYRFEAIEGWACPHCRTRTNPALQVALFWQCNRCSGRFAGAMHCAGSCGKASHCACGECFEREFVPTEFFDVRGEASAAARGNPPKASRPSALTPASSQAAGPALPQLTWRK
jgi:hypothetical protein